MARQVEAVYEHGVLRPLEPLTLQESQRVKLTIADTDAGNYVRDTQFRKWAAEELAAMGPIPSIDEVQAILSKIPGSLVEDFIEERGEW